MRYLAPVLVFAPSVAAARVDGPPPPEGCAYFHRVAALAPDAKPVDIASAS